jgi:hypothetical protein
MNEDIRSALTTAVRGAPPLGFTSAEVIRTARGRRARRRVAGVAGTALAVAATVTTVLAALPATRPTATTTTTAAATRPGPTQRELAARLDHAVRAAVPPRLKLLPREVRWLERQIDANGVSAALWRAMYLVGSTDGPKLNVAATEPPPAGQEASCARESEAITCAESTAPDGSRLVTLTVSAGGDPADPLLLHGVQNARLDGTEVAAYVIAPRSAGFPLTDAQLTRIATDRAIRYQRPSDVGPPPNGQTHR